MDEHGATTARRAGYLLILGVVAVLSAGAGAVLVGDRSFEESTTAADRLAILDIISSYQILVDQRDRDGYASLFTPDGVLDAWFARARGTSQLRKALDDYHLSGFTAHTRHMSGPATISITGSTASAISYWWIVYNDEPLSIVATGTFRDSFRNTSEGWRIVHRQQTTDQPPPLTNPGR